MRAIASFLIILFCIVPIDGMQGVSAETASIVVQAPFDRKAWMDDYGQLKRALESSYSHLAWFASPESGVDLPSVDRQALDSLKKARSNAEAKDAIIAFVASFRDGHFAQVGAPLTAPQLPDPPLADAFASGRAACAAFGYAQKTSISFSQPFESLRGFHLATDGTADEFRTGIIDVDGIQVGIIRIPRFRASEFPGVCAGLWESLHREGLSGGPDTITDSVGRAWLEALAGRLRYLRMLGAQFLLVDIGGNGGGNDLGDWTVRLFSSEPVHSAPLLVTAGQAGVPFLEEQIENLKTAINKNENLPEATITAIERAISDFERRKSVALSGSCDMSWVWRERRKWGSPGCNRLVDAGFASGEYDYVDEGSLDSRVAGALYWASSADGLRGAWEGPVYLLVDDKTGSAAEMFAALMRDRDIARVVGVHTFGDGCGFMVSSGPLILTHSRLAFAVPNCVRLRSDGTDEVAGIRPDLDAAPLPGEGSRARAVRILTMAVSDFRR
ncbi:MAG: S41 family peptidase [Pseudomonadota bacterium]